MVLPGIEVNYASKAQAKLSEKQALEIYSLKIRHERLSGATTKKPSATLVAREFGVSDKAVRDIWRGRTWLRETATLDDPAEAARRLGTLRPPGRPRKAPKMDDHSDGMSEGLKKLSGKDASIQNNIAAKQLDPFYDDWPHWNKRCQGSSDGPKKINRPDLFFG
mmetsp:Transcript_78378/g.210856  ORF Transcript_78378/g.210856 Transcript_78378/m.210856 type:complete len:164 (-) Transcript_78378:333-824(-)